jgi:hypothetical protein
MNEKFSKLILIALAVVVILGLALAALWVTGQSPDVNPVQVQSVFLDINQDGNTDLLVKGWVIFNSPFELPQPTPLPGLPTQ